MFTCNAITKTTLSVLALLILCLICPAVVAQAPGEPQQGAINTSRSGIKNTSRLGQRIDTVEVELARRTGVGREGQWVITKVAVKNGEFDLAVLPAGEYELRFSDTDGGATTNRGITINTSHVEYSKAAANDDPKHNSDVGRLSVTLTGVVGGTLKQELKTDLGSQIGAELARAGKPKFENILFKADGRSAVKGTLRHDMVKSSIRNLK